MEEWWCHGGPSGAPGRRATSTFAAASRSVASTEDCPNGFGNTDENPAAMYRALSSCCALPVAATTGMVYPAARSCRHASSPSMRGM